MNNVYDLMDEQDRLIDKGLANEAIKMYPHRFANRFGPTAEEWYLLQQIDDTTLVSWESASTAPYQMVLNASLNNAELAIQRGYVKKILNDEDFFKVKNLAIKEIKGNSIIGQYWRDKIVAIIEQC